jgi:hypothetical protein
MIYLPDNAGVSLLLIFIFGLVVKPGLFFPISSALGLPSLLSVDCFTGFIFYAAS